MKLYIFEAEGWEREAFACLSLDHEIRYVDEPLTAANAAAYADAEGISTFIYSSLGAGALQALPSLRVIASRSTGVDHIDVDRCRERGITVCNVPSYGSNTVAEHVFALVLAISHRLEEAIDRTRKGQFQLRGLQGFDLQGKTLGVVGTGDIGLHALRIGKGFGMHLLAFDVAPNRDAETALGFSYVDLDTLLEHADIVTLHVPGNADTRHLISRPQFDRMKEGAILINTARGSVVDHKALVRALAEKKIAAAGLDVLPEEPIVREEAELLRSVYEESHNLDTLLANEVLIHMRNVLVTPHSAFYTREAVQRILDVTVDNLRKFADGEPQNIAA